MEERRQKFYPEEELVALVRSLDRPQDEGLFSMDVLVVYPHLEQEYTRVCPKRCDLATAAEKAANEAYSYDVNLTALREDIKLMVNNCYRFNGTKGPLANIAERFEAFAKEQIDAYVTKKAGGRRLSSLRLSAVTATAAETSRGKRQRVESKDTSGVHGSQKPQQHRGGDKSRSGEMDGLSATSAEMVRLVDSLNRREDQGAFAVDVAEKYPELKKSYEEVCPVKMNLTILRERAASGYYLGIPQPTTTSKNPEPQTQSKRRQLLATDASPSSVFGSTIAESLVLLRNDVELMVSNCVRFNSNVQSWVELARSFQSFAHKKIDDFVIRHVPALKGTRSGVDAYVTGEKQQSQQQLLSQASKSQQLHFTSSQDDEQMVTSTHSFASPSFSLPSTATATTYAMKGRAAEAASPPLRAPAVTVANYITPTIVPTALQPVFATPDALRRRLVSDHLHRETLRARLIRSSTRSHNDKGDNKNTINNGTNNNKEEEEGKEEEEEDGADKKEEKNSVQHTYNSAFSCRAVLCAFAASVREFYRLKRECQNFVNPFEYPRQEEQLYMDCIVLIEQQFERLFLHTLLYDKEKADFYDWNAEKAVRKIVGSSEVTSLKEKDHEGFLCGFGSSWLDDAHLCYLVRFLQHLPQLMGLACATTVHLTGTELKDARPALQITEVAKGVIEKLARITEELLTFIAQYEQEAMNMESHAEIGKEVS
ncbi:hypothetical protein ECC02_007210 [Trypanosoma cruzi]|uniref:Bromo domain-containing protein n=1 Tax=Trypanosoma cruzi TaxID=5693 RepID=A0A7J6XZB6_TRYCR|nr:hypothetical protein ECC02_007210 [Trypanosoma cruzi]